MGFVPQKTSTFLLCYLREKSKIANELSISLKDIIADLKHCQDKGDIHLYNFTDDPDYIPPNMKIDLEDLKQHGWASEISENPHVELTYLGMFFADLHQLPPQLSESIQNCFV